MPLGEAIVEGVAEGAVVATPVDDCGLVVAIVEGSAVGASPAAVGTAAAHVGGVGDVHRNLYWGSCP